MTLTDRILAIVAQATPQAPMPHSAIIQALLRQRPETTPDEPHDALEAMTTQRLLSTARITRGGVTHDVYWPTGLTKPALSGIKPKEPIAVPTQPDTLAQKLIKTIVAHGPLLAEELADRCGAAKNNIGGLLQHAIKTGSITTRKAYVAERGREMTHYMTATQAAEWDARDGAAEQIEIHAVPDTTGGHVMSHPDLETLRDLNSEIHALRNDVAARDLILNNLAGSLKVQHIADIPAALDDLIHALTTRAMTSQSPAGKPALLLIDSADLTEVEMLGADDDAQAMAMNSIELGHAARVLVVRIVGEATRRVEWKEAA